MKYAIHENGKVKNVVVCNDAAIAASKGWISVDEVDVNIGDGWTGSEFVAEEIKELIPNCVTRFQGKASLLNAGLLDEVEAIIADVGTSELIKMAWAEAPNFERQSPAVIAITAQAGLTSVDVDNLFIAAGKIVV